MIPYASCVCFGGSRGRSRAWKVLSAQKGTALVIGDSLYKELTSDNENNSILTRSEISMLEAVKHECYYTLPFAEQEARIIGRRTGQPVITEILDLSLLDGTYNGVTKLLLSRCNSWSFNTFNLDVSTGGHSLSYLLVHLFEEYGFVKHFQLDIVKVWHCFNLMEAAYHRHNPYHNSVHAADVTQAMHCFLQENKFSSHLTPLEAMASVIAAVAHDLDHPGVTQAFLVATSNHLVNLYHNSSVLENHHWRTAISCLCESGIFNHFEKESWKSLQGQIRALILATDITRQKEFLARFKGYLTSNTLNMKETEYRHFALQIALKCADLCNPCRPWAISQRWSYQVCQEFYRQGAYEKQLNLPLTPTFDCSKTKVAKIQADFFQFVVKPLFETWDHFLKTPLSGFLLKNLHHNFCQWQQRITVQQIDSSALVKEIPLIKIDSISSENIMNSNCSFRGKQFLLAESDVVLKQHRSKSDSGLVPPLLSSKLHMETYSTEELHPSTTLLSLSSITNAVQLRQVYATTKIESHLICPMVFQPLKVHTFTSEIVETEDKNLFSENCDKKYCSSIKKSNQNDEIKTDTADTSCLHGCGTPPDFDNMHGSYDTTQRSNSLVNYSDIVKVKQILHRRASDFNYELNNISTRCDAPFSTGFALKNQLYSNNKHCSVDKMKIPNTNKYIEDELSRSLLSKVFPNKENFSLYLKSDKSESEKVISSWDSHIRRSFSAERPVRYMFDFHLPLPSNQGSSPGLHLLKSRRGSAPVTYNTNLEDHLKHFQSFSDKEHKNNQPKKSESTHSSGRRWSIPFEVTGFSVIHNSQQGKEKNSCSKMYNRRSSFGILEPFLTMSMVDTDRKSSRNCALKNLHHDCHLISSNKKNEELIDKSLISDSFFHTLPTSQILLQRRGSLPLDLYNSKEKNTIEESTTSYKKQNFSFEDSRKSNAAGDFLSVLIGSSGMLNAIHDLVNAQTMCGLPSTVNFESSRRKSGGLEMTSGLWQSRTNEGAIGNSMFNKLMLRRQLLEAWSLYRKDEKSSVSPTSAVSSVRQYFLHQQRRGSVPLSLSSVKPL